MEVAQGGPVGPDLVARTIGNALSHVAEQRNPAEQTLRRWEADAAPGFLSSLLRIVQQSQAIDEATRLMAAVVAKNAVGSSWRKTLGTREWSRIPPEEQALVKELALQLLAEDPSDRVAMQLSLLIANVCRFDFPGTWEGVLQQLLAGADWASPLPPERKLRALRALKPIFAALATKRFVMVGPQPGQPVSIEGMRALTARMNAERLLYKERLQQCSAPLQRLLLQHLPAFLTGGDNWQMHGMFAKAACNALTQLLYLIPSSEALPEGTRPLLEAVHGASTVILNGNPQQGALNGAALEGWRDLGGRLYERLTKLVMAHLDAFPLPFAEFVPYFLALYVDSAIIRLDATTLHSMRPKRRVLLVRFIAKALLCPFYRPEWLEAHQEGAQTAAVVGAYSALETMLTGAQCNALVEALLSKYVALTPDELVEWQEDPEGYVRSMDVETGPDADTPRPVGIGLLLCMLERGGEGPVQALIGLAASLQQQAAAASPGAAAGAANGNAEAAVLLREACYRAIGEGFQHVAPYVDFGEWCANELAPQLKGRLAAFMHSRGSITDAVLQARALWLVGICGGELSQEQWVECYQLAVAHMACADLVVALTAVQSVTMMSVQILDDNAQLEQMTAQQRDKAKNAVGGRGVDEALTAAMAGVNLSAAAEVEVRLAWRLDALHAVLSQVLSNSFTLLARLSEVESSVRLLQLISVVTEGAGAAVEPHLNTLAAALPQVWEAASQQQQQKRAGDEGGGADTGALARLHSALIAVLTHLVGKLRGKALGNAQVASVVYPLLAFATDLSSPSSEVLVEEAFRLWAVALSTAPSVAPQMLALLPNLAALLRRGKDNTAAFQILEGYLLLGAGAQLTPYGDVISQGLTASVASVSRAVLASCAPQPAAPAGPGGAAAQRQAQQQAAQQLASETSQEGLGAAALSDVMLQLFPADGPALLAPALREMAGLIASEVVPMQNMPIKVLNLLEGFLEVLARLLLTSPNALGALLEGGYQAAERLIDRWLTVASTQFLEELLGVRFMAMLGRFRRRIGTLAMCGLITSGAVPASMFDAERATRLCALMTRVAHEDELFRGDITHLDGMDFQKELGEDYVLAKRLEVSKRDSVRTIPLMDALRAALTALSAAFGSEQNLVAACAAHGGEKAANALQHLLTGQPAAA